MTAKRVLVTDGLQDVGIEALRTHGLDVDVVKTLPEAELDPLLQRDG